MRRRLIIAIVVLVAVGGYFLWPRQRVQDGKLESSGTIEATQVDVASKVAGRVMRLAVAEGDAVTVNQVVAELDHAELDAQIAQARAAVAVIQTRVPQAEETVSVQTASVETQVRQARAQLQAALASQQVAEANWRAVTAALQAAEATRARAVTDQARTEQLYKEGAVSAQAVDAVRTAVATAAAQRDAVRAQREAAQMQRQAAAAVVEQARATIALAETNRGTIPVRRLDTTAARAQLEQANAVLQLALIIREHAILRSPIAGVVLSKNVEVGSLVGVGTPVLTVGELSRVYLRVYIGEPDLAKVKLKQPVEVRVNAFPRRVFRGEVTEISSRAEFTPGNVQTREERVKLVFAVKVTLPNPDGDLKPGLPADAVIVTGTAAGH